MKRLALALILVLGAAWHGGCGGSNTAAPQPTPTPVPTAPAYKTSYSTSYGPFGIAFSPSGTSSYVSSANGNTQDYVVVYNNWAGAATWSSYGTTAFKANDYSVAVDPSSGNVYLLDNFTNDAVYEFTSAGVTVNSFTGFGSTPFTNIQGLAVAPNGNVFILDNGPGKVYVYNSSGVTVASWSCSGDGYGFAVSPVSPYNVYVGANTSTNLVTEYSSSGVSITSWGGTAATAGVGQGKFEQIQAVSVAPNGNVYVSDSENGSSYDDFVQEFSPSGTFYCQWGGTGSGNGQLHFPYQIAFSGNDVYVVDDWNSRIVVFGP